MKSSKARKNTGYVCMALGLLLLMSAAALLLFNRSENEKAGSSADQMLPAVIDAISETEAENPDAAEDADMPEAEIDGEVYIGYLSIPALELELPVMSEWSYDRLKLAPCRYFGSTVTDNLVICGHNYDRHFGKLKNLQTGELVTFTQMDGVVIAYTVAAVETLQPTQISEMIDSGYDLSLYTCTYGGQSRVTVRCVRAE